MTHWTNPRKLTDREKAQVKAWPHRALERRAPTDDDRPPPSTFPGKPPKAHRAQLTLTQATDYPPAA